MKLIVVMTEQSCSNALFRAYLTVNKTMWAQRDQSYCCATNSGSDFYYFPKVLLLIKVHLLAHLLKPS